MNATKTFQSWLLKARKKSKLSYNGLADKSNVSSATIHALEHGEGSPSLDTAEKLAKALGTSLEAAVRVRSAKARQSNIDSAEPGDPRI